MNAAPRHEPWAQAIDGRAIDLVNPRVEQVDFKVIAEVLARINRYGGNSEKPITVAQHSLIALASARQRGASPTLQAMVVLHDGHEWIIGDWTTPAVEAIVRMADSMFGPTERDRFKQTLDELKRVHDRVIFEAAGLQMPTREQQAFITGCDLVALNTERRDFLCAGERQWRVDSEAYPPLRRKQASMAPAKAADDLYRQFRILLPALRDGTARRAGR